MRNNAAKFLTGQVATVSAFAFAFVVATGMAQLHMDAPAWHSDSAVHLTSDLAVATGLGWTVYQLFSYRHMPRKRGRWMLAFGAMAMLGVIQSNDWLVGSGIMNDDWMVDVPLWLVATATVRAVLRRGREQFGAMLLWRIGVLLQSVFIICDLSGNKLFNAWTISAEDVASISEWCELLAIEFYVLALVIAGRIFQSPASATNRAETAIGAEARRIFEQANLFCKAIYPPVPFLFWPGFRGGILSVGIVGLVAVLGPAAKRASGRTLRAQLNDLIIMCIHQDFDPLAYYFQELYHEGGRVEAAFYLTRNETKNGLFHVLNSMRFSPDGPREMKDKVLFAACCKREGIAVPQTLFESDGEKQVITNQSLEQSFDRDLFCKLRSGRGARGVLMFRRIAPNRYQTPEGDDVDLDALIKRIQVLGIKVPLIVQPRLRNHVELADLADQSLVAVRVLTCLDSESQPIVTHAFLRILSKLEPAWLRKDEYGVPIELDTGRLGLMSSDRIGSCALRFSHHPVFGQVVEGRILKTWPAIRTLALDAHRAFSHRIIVGWDIAMTDEGPMLLEGNVNLDIMFPQRVYRQGIGRSLLGPLLQHHLAELARSENVH
jgi:hypothetical protein